MQKKFDDISDEVKKLCEAGVIELVDDLTDEEIGVIAAQEIIDVVTQHYGPEIYNRAIDEAKKAMQEKLTDLDFDLEELKQSS